MLHLITELSKYTMIILFALYTWQCFSALNKKVDLEEQAWKFKKQVMYMYLFHLNAYGVLYLSTKNQDLLKFYLEQVVFFLTVQVCYRIFYKRVSKLIVNNMCMLMCIGFVVLTRLSYKHAVKQFVIAVISMAITMLIPFFISRWKFVRSLTWMYALAGITMLGVVAVLGAVSHGAKLSFSVAGVTIQPSEFIKIIFVFFVASMFYESTEFIQVVKATVVAAMHVVILVLSRDLGAALIFFIAYLVMLYVATRKLYYFAGGLLCGAAASVVAYYLFNHVRVRVVAWQDPLAVFEREGNQISNSLFAIGTGGWFGMGLNQGMPYKIPEVKQDFIFSAVAEELGGIFAICLILVCVSCFLMFLNIAMQIKDFFYKLVALGLGTIYGFQIFLSIGGDIKFIPSTGVTLPLVSYGGSSLLSTLIIFAIIQGLYLMRERGEEEMEIIEKPKKKKKKQTGRRLDEVEEEIFQESKEIGAWVSKNLDGEEPESSRKSGKKKRKGRISSHEETIHGTKVQDFD
ncbi:hypothetical protein C806_02217 [Lachnospiraceae bacterium 3-1]|nr:hypothetical protein C806_02217 [Lachnospiraceae bacterium 3-1]